MTASSPPTPRVLLVEDDASLRAAISAALRGADYLVHATADGTGAGDHLDVFRPDVAILDVRLPAGPDGFELAASIRSHRDVPVVFVTAADDLADRLRGFEVGADDYLVKPFAMAELLARVHAVLRRAGRLVSPTIELRDIVLDETARVVHRNGTRVDLTKTEFDLLRVLLRSPGRVFSKLSLLSTVWGFDQYTPNLVEVHMSALRRKLEALGPRVIHTERGEGYVVRP